MTQSAAAEISTLKMHLKGHREEISRLKREIRKKEQHLNSLKVKLESLNEMKQRQIVSWTSDQLFNLKRDTLVKLPVLIKIFEVYVTPDVHAISKGIEKPIASTYHLMSRLERRQMVERVPNAKPALWRVVK